MHVDFLVAFLAGLASFFAPCVVPLLPAYIGYVTGVSIKELQEKGQAHFRRQIIISSILYVLGFSVVFMMLGTTAASLGSVLGKNRYLIQTFGGLLIMIFALSFMGVLKFKFLQAEHRFKLPDWVEQLGYARAFIVGMVFATAWTPCVGAILGSILTLAAASSTALSGALLLFVYSLGISIPFLLISLFLTQVPRFLKVFNRYVAGFSKIAGVLLFVVGFLLFNNNLQLISPLLTYNRLNGVLFTLASQWGVADGLSRLLGN